MSRKPRAPVLNPGATGGAIDANSTKASAPWVHATGFRTSGLRHRTVDTSNASRIAEEFLINTRLVRNDAETGISIGSYFTDAAMVMLSMNAREDNSGLDHVKLAASVQLPLALGEAIARRRSVRSFTGDAIELDYLATIIRAAAGVTGRAEVELETGGSCTIDFRATPSGGGLYPNELVIAALRVRSLERGVYRYDPADDALVTMGDKAEADALLGCFAVTDEAISISRSCAIFFIVGQPWKSMRKYGHRGMRFVFLEAGYMCQNIHLATVGLGYASTDWGAIYDDEVHKVLDLDGQYKALINTIVVGYPG